MAQRLAWMARGSVARARVDRLPVLAAGPLAALAPWQAAFVVVGFPGLLLVPLWVLLREPERRRLQGERTQERLLSMRAVAAVVSEQRAALMPMFAGFAFVPLVSYAFAIWTPALFERSYGWNPAQIGLSFGLILLVFGTAGAYFGGYMNDLVARRGSIVLGVAAPVLFTLLLAACRPYRELRRPTRAREL